MMRKMMALMILLPALCGCMQLDVRVKLEEDGSATISERLGFPKRLLDQDKASGKDELRSLLAKDAAQARAKLMGAGTTLVSHEIRPAEGGGMESLAVYKIADINEFRFIPPFPAAENSQHSPLRITIEPCYKQRWAAPDRPGMMAVQFSMENVQRSKKAAAVAEATPLDKQPLRDLAPVLREMVKGFKFKIVFESYNKFIAGTYEYPSYVLDRETRVATASWPLVDLSDQNLDSYGNSILDNEEIMGEVLRGDWGGPEITKEITRRLQFGAYVFWNDHKMPLIYPGGMDYQSNRLVFKPSNQHFDKFFKGKPEGTADDKKLP
jgi:hypothetical protein